MSLNVIMPGGFHPFHAGHRALYEAAKKAFPDANFYVAATNDMKERPFPFALKEKLARLSGVKPGEFLQVKNPFQPREITGKLNPSSDVVLFVRSEKDKNEHPVAGGTKKDGTPSYFQPWDPNNMQPFGKHAHLAYLPTVEFGPGITSATEIRDAWPRLNDKRKQTLVMSLYPAAQKNPQLAKNIVQMFDQVMGGQQGVAEAKAKTPKKEVVGFTRESEFKTWKQYAQKEGYEIREAGNLPGSYAAFDDNGKRVGYFYNKFDLPNGYYHIGELITSVEDVAEGKEDKEDMFIKADPESDQLLRFAQQHYPTTRSKQQAFIKFAQRALKHSEEEDKAQDQEIAQLQQDVAQIKDVVNKIQVSESADYLDEK